MLVLSEKLVLSEEQFSIQVLSLSTTAIMIRNRGLALALIAAVLCRPTAARSQTPAPSAPAKPFVLSDLKGEWNGTLILDNSSPQLSAVFDVADTTVTGKVFADGQEFGPMTDLKVTGNKVHFVVNRLDFTGTVVGSKMNVDLIVYNGSTRKLTLSKAP